MQGDGHYYTVGLVDGTGKRRRFRTEDAAATYISTLPNHSDGRYYLDGPIQECVLPYTFHCWRCGNDVVQVRYTSQPMCPDGAECIARMNERINLLWPLSREET